MLGSDAKRLETLNVSGCSRFFSGLPQAYLLGGCRWAIADVQKVQSPKSRVESGCRPQPSL